MEFIPTNPVLRFNKDQLKLVRKQYNLDKPGDMGRAIDVLEEWIKMQNHFMKKDLPRHFLEFLIIANKGSLERVKQRLDKICTFTTIMPEFFGENLTKSKYENINIMFPSMLLPKLTDENYRVYFVRCIGSSYTAEIFLEVYRYMVMICQYIMAHDYSDGVIVAVDYNEANIFEIVKALNLMELRRIIAIVTEGFGMRLRGIHLLTQSKAIDTLVTIIKQLLSPKLGNRISVHKDKTSFFQHLPKDIFPVEYGGKEKSVDKLCEDLRNEIVGDSFTSYIKEMSQAKTDESCRRTDSFNEHYLGMPGSFRTLNVD